MIVLVQGNERERNAGLMDQMHQLRARVFKDRLGWAVKVENGREHDRFDDEWTLYVLSVTDQNKVVGCLRVLQTTGPHMLSDVFSALIPKEAQIRSPLVWESTRFCVDTEYAKDRTSNELSRITGELVSGLGEAAVASGIEHIVSVYDLRMERILRRIGCDIERLAPPKDFGGILTVAGLFEVNEAVCARVRKISGLSEPTLPATAFSSIGAAA